MSAGTERGVSSTPIWFGPVDRRLFGWVHTPSGGTVRGGVVLFPPLGIEAICTYFTYRVLAIRLASEGLAVVRFDYDGTGDSAGRENDPSRVESWLASSTAAVDLLRSAGVTALGLIGIRMGAIFATREAVRRGGVDALVLWDPCESGRGFLREQQALRRLSLGGGIEPGTVDAPGLRFDHESVEGVSRLDLGREGDPLAERVLVLEHPGYSRPETLSRRLAGTRVDWAVAHGQKELLYPPLQETPWETVGLVAKWVSARVVGTPVDLPPAASGPAVVAVSTGGDPVTERPVGFGPGLFGILTEPHHPREAPAVVLVDEGNTPHIGQARLWVELARDWATLGFRVLRFDLSGNGDSPARPGQVPHGVCDLEAIDDILLAAGLVSPEDRSDVVLVGLCSGAYQAMETALLLRPRGLLLVNPYTAFIPSEVRHGRPSPRRAVQATRAGLVAVVKPAVRWGARRTRMSPATDPLAALVTGGWLAAAARRRPEVPGWCWDLAAAAGITRSPAEVFERLVDSAVDTTVVCGPDDVLNVTVGQSARLRRLARSGLFDLRVLDQLDHAALLPDERRKLRQVLTDHLLGFCSPGAERAAGVASRS